MTRQTITILVVLIIGYLIGARFPMIARRIGFAS